MDENKEYKEFQIILKKQAQEWEKYKEESRKMWSDYYFNLQKDAEYLLQELISFRKTKRIGKNE